MPTLTPRRGVLFDLDGTLLYTLPDLAAASNLALAALGFPPHPEDAYRMFVGDGVRLLLTRAAPPQTSPAQIAALVDHFNATYDHDGSPHTRLYPGVADLLDALVRRGVTLAILTNKPDPAAQAMARRLLGRWPWAAVQGLHAGIARKPDPGAALALAAQAGLPSDAWAYLGDSGVDMQTAAAAGMLALGATWGYRSREELRAAGAAALLDAPADVLAFVAG